MQPFPNARAGRPGVAVSLAVLLISIGALLAACAPDQPEVPTGRRVWEGPSTAVASRGVTTYERREIAQQVPLPACISIGGQEFGFTDVSTFPGVNPPGLTDTFYRLDRWRLWSRPGPLDGQPALFVTVRGSTGILAEYERLPDGEPCTGR
jgi:hypothetical protein